MQYKKRKINMKKTKKSRPPHNLHSGTALTFDYQSIDLSILNLVIFFEVFFGNSSPRSFTFPTAL